MSCFLGKIASVYYIIFNFVIFVWKDEDPFVLIYAKGISKYLTKIIKKICQVVNELIYEILIIEKN